MAALCVFLCALCFISLLCLSFSLAHALSFVLSDVAAACYAPLACFCRAFSRQEAAGLEYRRLADEQGSKLCELRLRA
mgnify:CR=1 FL=1